MTFLFISVLCKYLIILFILHPYVAAWHDSCNGEQRQNVRENRETDGIIIGPAPLSCRVASRCILNDLFAFLHFRCRLSHVNVD